MGQSLHQRGSSGLPPVTSNDRKQVREKIAHITAAAELRARQDACQQVSQSASQAIQQASQQASQSVQQASQQASQSVQQASQQASQASRQASQSASQAIQQAQQSASQSIAAASRTASSISSSASSVVSSIQASAESAIFQANLAMQTAQLSASLAQSEASKAVLAAQNSGPTVGSQISQANPKVTTMPTGTVTDTQLALAIVGSIIASSLITIIAHFIILRHKNLSRAARPISPGDADSIDDLKFPVSDGVTTTIETSNSAYAARKNNHPSNPHGAFSLLPKSSSGENKTTGKEKVSVGNTATPTEPTNMPRSPSLRSWLRLQNVSPFGPIQLPTNQGSEGPLGGQLKSPLRKSPPPRFILDVSLDKTISADILSPVSTSVSENDPTSRQLVDPKAIDRGSKLPSTSQSYRESKASEWTDAITDVGSAMLPSSPKAPAEPVAGAQRNMMRIPSPDQPIRNTAEWLMDHANFRSFSPDMNSRDIKQSDDNQSNLKLSMSGGLPTNPKGSNLAFRSRPRPNQPDDDAQASNRFLDPKGKNKINANDGDKTQPNTPGVGKAI